LQVALFKLLTCAEVKSAEFKDQQCLSGQQHPLCFHIICPSHLKCLGESGCRNSVLGLSLVYYLWKQVLKLNPAIVHPRLGKAYGKLQAPFTTEQRCKFCQIFLSSFA